MYQIEKLALIFSCMGLIYSSNSTAAGSEFNLLPVSDNQSSRSIMMLIDSVGKSNLSRFASTQSLQHRFLTKELANNKKLSRHSGQYVKSNYSPVYYRGKVQNSFFQNRRDIILIRKRETIFHDSSLKHQSKVETVKEAQNKIELSKTNLYGADPKFPKERHKFINGTLGSAYSRSVHYLTTFPVDLRKKPNSQNYSNFRSSFQVSPISKVSHGTSDVDPAVALMQPLENVTNDNDPYSNSSLETDSNKVDQSADKILEEFISKHPVELWETWGLFDKDYLRQINIHWLQYDAANSSTHYSFAAAYTFFMVFGCGGNAFAILMFIR